MDAASGTWGNILRGSFFDSLSGLLRWPQRPVKHRGKQIQPAPGSEKVFRQALQKIRESKRISQERLALDAGLTGRTSA
jgi:hypothetical protein